MAKLPKFTLTHNEKKDRWDLTNDATDKTVKSFENKADALAGRRSRKDTWQAWRVG